MISRFLHQQANPAGEYLSLRGILTNPAYTGQVYAGRMHYRPPKIRRSATHPIGHPHDSATLAPQEEWIPVTQIPAIVSQEQFELVQAKLAKNQSFASRHNTAHQYLLRALVSCGICQLSCYARTVSGKSYGYYICTGKDDEVQARHVTRCPSRFIPAQQLDELVWKDLCDLLTHPELLLRRWNVLWEQLVTSRTPSSPGKLAPRESQPGPTTKSIDRSLFEQCHPFD